MKRDARHDRQDEEDLRERGAQLITRLVSVADRLMETANELRGLADNLRDPSTADGSTADANQ